MNEKGPGGLQHTIESACKQLGLVYYHTWSSKHSPAGYPDLIIQVTRPCLAQLVVELKAEKRRPSSAQVGWLDFYAKLADQAPELVEVYLWRPRHWFSGVIPNRLAGRLVSADGEESGRWAVGGVLGDRWSTPALSRGTIGRAS
jgi:hypothetical protein